MSGDYAKYFKFRCYTSHSQLRVRRKSQINSTRDPFWFLSDMLSRNFFPSNFRSFTIMQSSYSRYRRHPVKRSQIPGLDQAVVADGGRQMTSMATAVAPIPQHSTDRPAHREGRHFTNKKFADAPISLESKQAINHP